jgi:hypothetical protein
MHLIVAVSDQLHVIEKGSSGISVGSRGRLMEGCGLGRVPKWTHFNHITPVCSASIALGGWNLSTSILRIDESRSASPTLALA